MVALLSPSKAIWCGHYQIYEGPLYVFKLLEGFDQKTLNLLIVFVAIPQGYAVREPFILYGNQNYGFCNIDWFFVFVFCFLA